MHTVQHIMSDLDKNLTFPVITTSRFEGEVAAPSEFQYLRVLSDWKMRHETDSQFGAASAVRRARTGPLW